MPQAQPLRRSPRVVRGFPHARLRLTAAGWLTILLSWALISTLFWQDLPLALFLGLSLAVGLLYSIFVAPFDIRGVRGRWMLPAYAHAGEIVTVGAEISAQPATGPLAVWHYDPGLDRYVETCRIPGPSPTPSRLSWNLRFVHRGNVELPPVEVVTTYPFGMVAARRPVSEPVRFLVFPAVGRVTRQFRSLLERWDEDSPKADRRGDDEFAHLRSYRPGDPVRRIHWRASARARTLLVGERHMPHMQSIGLYCDVRSALTRSNRLERLIAIVATLVDHLHRDGWLVQLYGQFTDDEALLGNREDMLTALANAEPAPKGPFTFEPPEDLACLVFTLDEQLRLPATEGRCRVLDLPTAETMVRLPRLPR